MSLYDIIHKHLSPACLEQNILGTITKYYKTLFSQAVNYVTSACTEYQLFVVSVSLYVVYVSSKSLLVYHSAQRCCQLQQLTDKPNTEQ